MMARGAFRGMLAATEADAWPDLLGERACKCQKRVTKGRSIWQRANKRPKGKCMRVKNFEWITVATEKRATTWIGWIGGIGGIGWWTDDGWIQGSRKADGLQGGRGCGTTYARYQPLVHLACARCPRLAASVPLRQPARDDAVRRGSSGAGTGKFCLMTLLIILIRVRAFRPGWMLILIGTLTCCCGLSRSIDAGHRRRARVNSLLCLCWILDLLLQLRLRPGFGLDLGWPNCPQRPQHWHWEFS